MSGISVLVVDDEPLAREGLALRLAEYENITVLGCCNNAKQAYDAISVNQPDVVFLDIEMPGKTGLELAEQLREEGNPATIVFVTAFREFAVNAFDFQASDYLLKPFSEERLKECIEKLSSAMDMTQVVDQHKKLGTLLSRKTGNSIDSFIHSLEVSNELSNNNELHELQQIISLKSGSQWIRVKLDDIVWIEAAGDYMCVHTINDTHIIRKTLKQFEEELDSVHFPRVSRSAIINIAKLSTLTPNSNGEYVAELGNNVQVKVGRKYKFCIEELKPRAC
ncbi:MAG: DNA-binding response regulator [Alteromonadaceae bacterium]|jgi:two-component system LytT family response regulator|uniref:Response regulator receiver protein n=1 Tax=Paraglaciecola agarilytica NO2 TaxID=1125747 RepID=A0ABQ0IDC8_9ALTE|nr:LytTR family DNA-binding domain-containing protein [Paraglaciecola agarilytica]MBN26091.1 DNA-binding response regulator [Alteromonadaceae bacterium]GAC07403.1 response regulator receiver protein [Paraglaciecola agarilytica NO2]|tara:strand:- start:10000 stop:10836 length:837 start_codon:yes stop_codon:yes gene_type:complete